MSSIGSNKGRPSGNRTFTSFRNKTNTKSTSYNCPSKFILKKSIERRSVFWDNEPVTLICLTFLKLLLKGKEKPGIYHSFNISIVLLLNKTLRSLSLKTILNIAVVFPILSISMIHWKVHQHVSQAFSQTMSRHPVDKTFSRNCFLSICCFIKLFI